MPAARSLPWVLVVAAGLASSCVPGLGPFRLAEAHGRVVDRDSGAPVEGALVLQWYHGASAGDGPRPEYAARWTTTGTQGRFAFASALAPSPRMWLLRTYGPSYAFHHPELGLVRGARPDPEDPGALLLLGARSEAELRRPDLAPYCRGEIQGAGARELARVACEPRPPRPARE